MRDPRHVFLLLLLAALIVLSSPGHAVLAASPPASFACVLQADAFAGTKPAAVAQLAACGRDWLVLDAMFSGDNPWTPQDIAAIRQGRAGRQAIAYLSIGEAEEYRPYWRKEWTRKGRPAADAPSWLGNENPEWKGNHRVKYWRPEWQRIMLAAVDDAMARGFDGVYLDVVDAFESFEQEGRDFIDDRVNPETGQSYRRDMVEWVRAVAARARARNPAALAIPQNGSQLLAHEDFVAVISAIGIEDLFTNGDRRQSASHVRQVLADLSVMAAARKPVLLIEYPRPAELRALSKRQAAENGFVWLVTDRQLTTLGESGR